MAAVALVGPDGSGKTSIAQRLAAGETPRCRYLYMGIEPVSSNLVLPTTRLLRWVRRRAGRVVSEGPPRTGERASRRPGALRAMARLLNRASEAWYRQLASWYFQARGELVIYDRHFALDFAPELAAGGPEPLDRRLNRWLLVEAYPQPDLVIFLDAPGEVLHARKGESDAQELERRRQAFLRQGQRLPGFVRIDATRPFEEVYAEVERTVLTFARGGRNPELSTSWSGGAR